MSLSFSGDISELLFEEGQNNILLYYYNHTRPYLVFQERSVERCQFIQNLKVLCLIRKWGLLRETGDGYESCSGLYSSKGGGLITSKLGRSKTEMFTVLLCELS